MRAPAEHEAINRMLKSHGLSTLGEPGILEQLGFIVQDHEHLRSLLIRCEPEQRVEMYNSLVPNLRFTARPLDTYIAESAQRAEVQQLPTVDEDGNYHWSKLAPEVQTEDAKTIAGIVAEMAKFHLEVVCRKCTKAAVFHGGRKIDAIKEARDAGWVYCREGESAFEICPDCLN